MPGGMRWDKAHKPSGREAPRVYDRDLKELMTVDQRKEIKRLAREKGVDVDLEGVDYHEALNLIGYLDALPPT